MSQIASFYVLTKPDFTGLGKITEKLPKTRIPKGARLMVQAVPPEEATAAAARYEGFWNYLQEHGKEPYKFKWSGSVMVYLLDYLREKKQIDFAPFRWDTGDDTWTWYCFDKKCKDKYLAQLDPAKFQKSELQQWYEPHAASMYNTVFSFMGERLGAGKDELKQRIKQMSDFPEAGQAMLDGITILHQYLALVDDTKVVLFNIG